MTGAVPIESKSIWQILFLSGHAVESTNVPVKDGSDLRAADASGFSCRYNTLFSLSACLIIVTRTRDSRAHLVWIGSRRFLKNTIPTPTAAAANAPATAA